MGRVMYIECRSGAAGDMLLGALVDAGLPLAALEQALGSLQVDHALRVERVVRAGISATKVDVRRRSDADTPAAPAAPAHAHNQRHHAHGHHTHDHHTHDHDHPHHEHHHEHEHDHADGHSHAHSHAHGHHHGHDHAHRTLAEIATLIGRSALPAAARDRAVALFHRLGEAEAAIHAMPLDQVHLHEVGALDSIIDIVGVVFALDWFGIDDIVVSPLNVGGGTVEIAHGRVPVPAPATLSLLKGVPVYNAGPDVELVTPTGALLVSAYARSFGAMPAMTPERVGYGAGTRDFDGVPNVVRVIIGERLASGREASSGTVVTIECEIDDMNPQLVEPAAERLRASGALDVFVTPILMKKGRPGHLLTVIAPPERRPALCEILFRETSTIGVRFTTVERDVLDRRWDTVEIPGGQIRVKVAGRDGQTFNVAPEFEDCLRVAEASGRPLKLVQADAIRAWWGRPQ